MSHSCSWPTDLQYSY